MLLLNGGDITKSLWCLPCRVQVLLVSAFDGRGREYRRCPPRLGLVLADRLQSRLPPRPSSPRHANREGMYLHKPSNYFKKKLQKKVKTFTKFKCSLLIRTWELNYSSLATTFDSSPYNNSIFFPEFSHLPTGSSEAYSLKIFFVLELQTF